MICGTEFCMMMILPMLLLSGGKLIYCAFPLFCCTEFFIYLLPLHWSSLVFPFFFLYENLSGSWLCNKTIYLLTCYTLKISLSVIVRLFLTLIWHTGFDSSMSCSSFLLPRGQKCVRWLPNQLSIWKIWWCFHLICYWSQIVQLQWID